MDLLGKPYLWGGGTWKQIPLQFLAGRALDEPLTLRDNLPELTQAAQAGLFAG